MSTPAAITHTRTIDVPYSFWQRSGNHESFPGVVVPAANFPGYFVYVRFRCTYLDEIGLEPADVFLSPDLIREALARVDVINVPGHEDDPTWAVPKLPMYYQWIGDAVFHAPGVGRVHGCWVYPSEPKIYYLRPDPSYYGHITTTCVMILDDEKIKFYYGEWGADMNFSDLIPRNRKILQKTSIREGELDQLILVVG